MQWADAIRPPAEKTLRQFAALFLIVFAVLGGVRWWHGSHRVGVVMLVAAVVIGIVGMIRPAAIRWLFTGWMIVAFPIGWTVSQVMLALLFFLVFTPLAAVFRLLHRDALQLRRPERVDTYWTAKPTRTDVKGYLQQF